MTQSNNILQKLRELKSLLANISLQNIYSVPTGYFESLPARMLDRIKAMDASNASEELSYLSPELNKISKLMPYAVPTGYFEGLGERIMDLVRESKDYQTAKEELENISPLLSGLRKQMPYSVPDNYFQTLNPEINKGAKTKVVSITSRKWYRYAVAAMIAGVIALGGFLFVSNKVNNTAEKKLARLEKSVDKEIKKTSDEDLKAFIQQFTDAGLNGEEKAFNVPKSEAKDMLKDVPDAELKKFLDETADPDAIDDNVPVN